jgi:hypothetical protein
MMHVHKGVGGGGPKGTEEQTPFRGNNHASGGFLFQQLVILGGINIIPLDSSSRSWYFRELRYLAQIADFPHVILK